MSLEVKHKERSSVSPIPPGKMESNQDQNGVIQPLLTGEMKNNIQVEIENGKLAGYGKRDVMMLPLSLSKSVRHCYWSLTLFHRYNITHRYHFPKYD